MPPDDRLRRPPVLLCHAFGMEQMHLSRLEVRIARRLAALGFPTLRYQGVGYGDSDGSSGDVTLSTHRRDLAEAASVLRELSGQDEVGLIGIRLGALVAAITADEVGAPLLGLIDPVVSGSHYVRDFLRTEVFTSMTGEVDDETSDELLYLMQQVNRMSDVTFVIATHDPDVASCMDRMIRLSDGRVTSDQRLRSERVRLSSIR